MTFAIRAFRDRQSATRSFPSKTVGRLSLLPRCHHRARYLSSRWPGLQSFSPACLSPIRFGASAL